MVEDKGSYPNRPPDVDTPYFNIWKSKEEENLEEQEGFINLGKGETVYEIRGYNSLDPEFREFIMFVMSKKKDDQIYVGMRLKSGREVKMDAIRGWVKETEYESVIRDLEKALLGMGFDVDNPKIMEGKHLNLYME